MRMRIVVLVVLALAAVGGRWLLYPQSSTPASPISSPAAQSFLVILGIGDKAATNWDGSISATGATILSLEGWRLGAADSISGTSSWKMSTRTTPSLTPPGPFQETGVIVTIGAATGPVTFDVKTTQGNFSFSSQGLPFGVSTSFLGGKALVAQTGAPLQLTSSDEEEDFPSMAQSGDDIYLAYTRFVMALAGVKLPLESYPLQALVSEPIKPIFPCVVMSNTIHAYISQSDKGELVIGAGTDAYTSYTQRGALHVNTHTLDAICELFPTFRRMRMLRNWGGIVDVTPDRSPIIAKTPVPGLYVNCGWGTGGFKATPGSANVFAWTIAPRRTAPDQRAVHHRTVPRRLPDRRGRGGRRGSLSVRPCCSSPAHIAENALNWSSPTAARRTWRVR